MASRLPAFQNVGHVRIELAGTLAPMRAFRDRSLCEPASYRPTAFAQVPGNLSGPQPLGPQGEHLLILRRACSLADQMASILRA